MELEQPTSIGKYEILSVIGRGGMGIVYRAQDPLMGRQVAIKTVTEGLSTDAGMLQRFYGEAEKMGMLRHPNIITVYDLGEQNGFPFIVMEFVEGDPLDRLIHSEQPIPLHSKLHIMEQVCGALAYAHQNKVIHRDVKPANVIVRPDGVAKLLDFGIAREENIPVNRGLTDAGGVIGTVPYMAPERLRRAPFDGRSDIFAAGVLLFQFLTGRLPFTGTEYVLVNQLLNDKHPPLSEFIEDYPLALDGILDRSLAKDPTDRYQTADEMAGDLYSIIETLRQEHSVELMRLAQHLSSEGDYIGAQDALSRLLKLDNKNTRARVMAREIGLRITSKVRAAQAEAKQREAQDAVRDRKFDQAIQLLEEALGLVPDDGSIVSQLEAARMKKRTNEQICGFLQQAEAARNHGDYTGARAIVEKAIQLDTNNSRLRAAYQSLVRQAEDAARQARFNDAQGAAQDALRRRDYEAVLDLVQQAQPIDPDNLELKELARAANDGIFQQQRRRLLQDIEDQLSTVMSREDAERIADVIHRALEKTPTDAILLRYQAQIDRTVHEYQTRALVDETVRECSLASETAPLEALEKVRNLLINVPGDPRLVSLETRIQQRIEHMTAEEARTAVLLQAREFLKQRKFARAVEILEQCRPPILTPEIGELLDYARQESRHEEQQQLVVRSFAEGQLLLREEKHEDLVRLLGPIVQATDDPRLRSMLNQAEWVIEERRTEHAAALSRAKAFADVGLHEQVVALVRSLPQRVSNSIEMRALERVSQVAWTQEWTGWEDLGRAYAALDSSDWETIPSHTNEVGGSAFLQKLQKILSGRAMAAADQILVAQIKDIHEAKAAGLQLDPSAHFADNRRLLPFASDAIKEEWCLLVNEHNTGSKKGKFFAWLGRRHP
jgi:eukaryotic-like serine/threonine-protein kinase